MIAQIVFFGLLYLLVGLIVVVMEIEAFKYKEIGAFLLWPILLTVLFLKYVWILVRESIKFIYVGFKEAYEACVRIIKS